MWISIAREFVFCVVVITYKGFELASSGCSGFEAVSVMMEQT